MRHQVSAEKLESIGHHLLQRIEQSGSLLLSTVVDEDGETIWALLEYHSEGGLIDAILSECAGDAVEAAAAQLDEQGLITRTDVEPDDPWDSAPSEDDDYQMSLTRDGRRWCSERFALHFRDAIL